MQTGTMRLRELTIRYTVKRLGDGTPALTIQTARAPRDCAAALMRLLEDEPSEVFAMLCLNTKLRVLAYHEVSRGSLDTTVVHPREVFRAAILANDASVRMALQHLAESGFRIARQIPCDGFERSHGVVDGAWQIRNRPAREVLESLVDVACSRRPAGLFERMARVLHHAFQMLRCRV
jgi:hypothetical protein